MVTEKGSYGHGWMALPTSVLALGPLGRMLEPACLRD